MLPLLLACAAPPDEKPAPAPEPAPPDVEIGLTTLDLGRVRIGETLTGTLTVNNHGGETLRLDTPILEDGTGKFGVAPLATPYVLAGGSVTVDLTFTADAAGAASARLLLPSDDPDEPVLELVVVALATAPALTLDPPAVDFGTIEELCEDTHGVALRNDGDEDLVVTAVAIEGGQEAFAVDLAEDVNGPLPWTLAPGEAAQVWVDFRPPRDTAYAASLVVTSDTPANPSSAAMLDGDATPNARVIDNFITMGKPLDFVFAVGGTDADGLSAALVDALPALVAPLSAVNVDFQVAAIRADDGCLVNGLLPNHTMTAEEQASAFSALLATSGTEHTLTVLERALAEASAAGCNPDLVRRQANLVLVGVTDLASAAPQAVGVYTTAFEGVKADAAQSAAWALAPDGGDCGEIDLAWDAVTAATGGSYLSVCDDVATSLATLAEASIERQDTFPLSRLAWPDTLVVQIDRVTTRDWTYDTAANAIVFDTDSAPLIDAEVRAFYDAIPVCGGE